MKLAKLIKIAKAKNNLTSEEALGKMIGVSGVTIMRWRRGISVPEVDNAYDLATLAGEDPAEVVAQVLILAEKRPEVRKTLERLKSALAAAAVIMLTVLPGAGPLQVEENSTVNNIHYTQLAKAIFKALLRSFAIFRLGDPRDQSTKMQSLLLPG